MELPRPARYFPLEKETYEVAPLLKPFGTDLGNGALERKVFQFDSRYTDFIESRRAAHREREGKYVVRAELSPEVENASADWIVARLLEESPEYFVREGATLRCKLSGNAIALDERARLLERLVSEVQEDFLILSLDDARERDWLSYGNACATSHWAPEEKIGMTWTQIHQPVPGAAPMLRNGHGIAKMMVDRGPFVRFVWGITAHDRPNHHPEPPAGMSVLEWKGPPVSEIFEARLRGEPGPAPFMWVERQIVWGMPAVRASIFTIRASFISLDEIRARPAERERLVKVLHSTAPDLRDYKGFLDAWEPMLRWLSA